MFWTISQFPNCDHQVFLSHCSEDKPWLVEPLYHRLQAMSPPVIPWVDRHHWPRGVPPYQALRDGILRCCHIVYLITLKSLDVSRGWQIFEKAYGGLVQDSFSFGGRQLSRVELPLFFVARNDPVLARSIWFPMVHNGEFHNPVDGPEVEWAVRQIHRFVQQAKAGALSEANSVSNDPTLREDGRVPWLARQDRDQVSLGETIAYPKS